MNLVIAIMSDTYAFFSTERYGVYLRGIIEAMPIYKNNREYGALISSVPVLNIFLVPFIPFYIGIRDEKTLRAFNECVSLFLFSPMVLLLVVFFLAGNIFCIPFAYIYALIHKVLIVIRNFSPRALLEVFIWLFLGNFFLVISVFVDLYSFVKLTLHQNAIKVDSKNLHLNLSHDSFK